MALMSGGEVVQFAVNIEQNGFAFYNRYAETLPEGRTRSIFEYLADQERNHIQIFSKMLGDVGSFKQTVHYPDEYFAYLQAYSENLIFKDGDLQKEIASIQSDLDAIEFGIRRELDSILYYQEMKSFVPKKDTQLIDEVIGEEREHFIKLNAFKDEL
jgi:rubrerythrin